MKLRSTIALFALFWAGEAHADLFSAGSLIIPMDQCYQFNGTAQYTRQGWNQGQPYGTAYSSANACVWLDNTTTPNTINDPYDGACLAGPAYPASPAAIQHAFGALYLLASNNIPVMVSLRANKEALGDYDFYVTSPDGTSNAVFYLKFSGGFYAGYELGGLATSTAGKNIYYRGAPFVIPASYAQKALSVLQAGPAVFNDVLIHVARSDFQAPVSGVIQTTPKPVGVI